MKPLVGLAVETGMRRGELLNIAWSDVTCRASFAYLL